MASKCKYLLGHNESSGCRINARSFGKTRGDIYGSSFDHTSRNFDYNSASVNFDYDHASIVKRQLQHEPSQLVIIAQRLWRKHRRKPWQLWWRRWL